MGGRVKSAGWLAVALAALAGGCIEDRKEITGTQSLKVDLVAPTDRGSVDSRLADSARAITVDVTALDANGNVDTTFNNDLQGYVQFLGTLTPYLGGKPLLTIHMTNGKATAQSATLPPVFGPTTLWLDDGADASPTFATGTTPTLWYRDPFIGDIQMPADETAPDALSASPLENKNVGINASRNGVDGRLVVTSVFAQGYTIADVKCAAGGVPPCVFTNNPTINALGYDSVDVFSFSAARDDSGNIVQEGEVLKGFTGGVTEFNGLTEVGFPQTFATPTPEINTALEPPALKVDSTWFDNKILFERAESSALEFDGVTVCPLDADYTTYKQWKISLDGNCTNTKTLINLISSGVIQLDPGMCVGKILPRVTGILRPVNIGSFNVWIVYPRSPNDLQLPAGDAQCKL